MNHIFSCSGFNNEGIGEILYRHISLDFPIKGCPGFGKKMPPECSFMEFNDRLIGSLPINITINLIAELTLFLCKSYMPKNDTVYPEDVLKTINLLCPNNDIINKNLINKFNNSILKDYEAELKDLLVLSYIYETSIYDYKFVALSKIVEAKNIYAKDENDPDTITLDYRNVKPNPTVLYQKLNNIYRIKKEGYISPLYLFLNLNEENNNFNIRNLYDIEIFLGLIHSKNKSSNPFVDLHGLNSRNFKLQKFLKSFQYININKRSRIDTLKILGRDSVNHKRFYVYNQFLLERITNVNFINSLWNILNQNEFPETFKDILYQLSSLPFLDLRIKILNRLNEDKKLTTSSKFPEKTSLYLKEFLQMQFTCTLPITMLVFKYLMQLSKKNHKIDETSFEKSVDTYFEELMTRNKFEFFDLDSHYIPYPNRIHMPYDVNNKSYQNLCKSVYLSFFRKTDCLKTENLYKKIELMETSKVEWLKNHCQFPDFNNIITN